MKKNMLFRHPSLGGVFLIALFQASPALALQSHGYSGLYVHQGAHLFFLLAMAGFVFRIHRTWLAANRSWRLISWGAAVLALWNVWAMSGHFLGLFVPKTSVVLESGHLVPSLAIGSWKEAVYYLLKMDHLLCVPALLFFYFGLRGILADFKATGRDA